MRLSSLNSVKTVIHPKLLLTLCPFAISKSNIAVDKGQRRTGHLNHHLLHHPVRLSLTCRSAEHGRFLESVAILQPSNHAIQTLKTSHANTTPTPLCSAKQLLKTSG
ncbi:hypothetical protein BLNAU_12483 [Blattamonas nauphoetae]|uniref:Uncharacterized protein n=1 Tax=Blattamonas nauphoetae TaxID=2049346 RepID=A0ABQ9XMH2_9EUKA|nr:hypothetical protein BLNAU_12483 [Blattamonas nauphoetae]